jgi:hypothetical protein
LWEGAILSRELIWADFWRASERFKRQIG